MTDRVSQLTMFVMSTKVAPSTSGRKPVAKTTASKSVTAVVPSATAGTKPKAKPAKAPSVPVKIRVRAPKGQGYADHRFERKAEEAPCFACGEPWMHSKGLCSKCYNAARKPLKAGKTGQALIDAVRTLRSVKPTPAMKRRDAKLAKVA